MDSQYSLRWSNYSNEITEAFSSLLLGEDLVDVTLSCEGKMIKAHKMLLSACSPYFHQVFKENPSQHPVIVFKNVELVDLKAIVDFIYHGEVNIQPEQLDSFLCTAELLEVKGLTEFDNKSNADEGDKENENADEPVREQPTRSRRKSPKSGRSSPPAKKHKPNAEKPNVEKPENTVTTPDIKEEPVEFDDSEVAEADPLAVDASTSDQILQDSNAPKDFVEKPEEPTVISDEEDVKEKEKPIPEEKTESKTSVSNKKTPSKELIKKIRDSQREIKEPKKTDVKIPKGLVVTSVKPKEYKDLFDFPPEQEVLRSENASTPINEKPVQDDQDENTLTSAAEPELANEVPILEPEQTELETPVEEAKEPEPVFDYFGCEICQNEAKPVDLERIVFNHKCPICPFNCFCSHILKDHMKIIHGWFSTQRRFTQY